jgi:hypothetical protein
VKLTHFALVSALALTSGACASRASSVAPISVSAAEYSYLGCQDARAELDSARAKEHALARKQNNAATTDAAAVFLFALPLGSVFGADVEGELAQAKGESLALQRRVAMACSAEAKAASTPVQVAAPSALVSAPAAVASAQPVVTPAAMTTPANEPAPAAGSQPRRNRNGAIMIK